MSIQASLIKCGGNASESRIDFLKSFLVKMKHNESLKVAFADDDKRRASVFSASEAGSEYCKRTKYNGPLTGKRE